MSGEFFTRLNRRKKVVLEKIFGLKKEETNVRTEILAGVTTFMTMAYIIVVNPKILAAAGIPERSSMTATILAAVFGTLMMAFYAKRPFAIAPYMGENAFIAYTVVGILGYSWQAALGAVFIGGVLFILLTVLRLRTWLSRAIPSGLKYSFAAGIGLFLTFIGLNTSGVIRIGVPDAPVKVGVITSPEVLLAVLTFILMAVLITKRIRGAIFLSMVISTFFCFAFKVAPLPEKWVSLPPSIAPILFKLSFAEVFTLGFFPVILVVFIMDFVDTMGTLMGVSARGGFLDKEGNLPGIEKPMLSDAAATVAGAVFGTTTTGTFIESAAGIEEGGRSGLTSFMVAVLFVGALFFAPFLTAVPRSSYGPALIVVGLLMLESITRIDFKDYTEVIPAFAVVVLMSFTYNIGVGMTAGFVLYPFFKLITGRTREVHPGLWVLGALSLLFYIFYPYG